MKEYVDAKGFRWQVDMGYWPVLEALKELRENLYVCMVNRTQEFYTAAFWYSIEQQARSLGITREQFLRNHLTLSDLFPGSKFFQFVAARIEEAIPKSEESNEGEAKAGENL